MIDAVSVRHFVPTPSGIPRIPAEAPPLLSDAEQTWLSTFATTFSRDLWHVAKEFIPGTIAWFEESYDFGAHTCRGVVAGPPRGACEISFTAVGLVGIAGNGFRDAGLGTAATALAAHENGDAALSAHACSGTLLIGAQFLLMRHALVRRGPTIELPSPSTPVPAFATAGARTSTSAIASSATAEVPLAPPILLMSGKDEDDIPVEDPPEFVDRPRKKLDPLEDPAFVNNRANAAIEKGYYNGALIIIAQAIERYPGVLHYRLKHCAIRLLLDGPTLELSSVVTGLRHRYRLTNTEYIEVLSFIDATLKRGGRTSAESRYSVIKTRSFVEILEGRVEDFQHSQQAMRDVLTDTYGPFYELNGRIARDRKEFQTFRALLPKERQALLPEVVDPQRGSWWEQLRVKKSQKVPPRSVVERYEIN